jgi:hypothetical protein
MVIRDSFIIITAQTLFSSGTRIISAGARSWERNEKASSMFRGTQGVWLGRSPPTQYREAPTGTLTSVWHSERHTGRWRMRNVQLHWTSGKTVGRRCLTSSSRKAPCRRALPLLLPFAIKTVLVYARETPARRRPDQAAGNESR